MIATADLVGAITTPGYDLLRDTVSHMMRPDAGYANVLRGVLISYGVLLIPFAFQIRRHFKLTRWWKLFMVVGIWLHIVFILSAALFQNDSRVSILGLVTVNTIHDVGTVVLFIAAMLTLPSAGTSAARAPRWSPHFVYAHVTILAMLCMTSILVLAITTDLNGITERANFGVFMGWMTLTAVSKDGWESVERP